MTLLDQMQKRPGSVMVGVLLFNLVLYTAMFIGALLIIKKIFF